MERTGGDVPDSNNVQQKRTADAVRELSELFLLVLDELEKIVD